MREYLYIIKYAVASETRENKCCSDQTSAQPIPRNASNANVEFGVYLFCDCGGHLNSRTENHGCLRNCVHCFSFVNFGSAASAERVNGAARKTGERSGRGNGKSCLIFNKCIVHLSPFSFLQSISFPPPVSSSFPANSLFSSLPPSPRALLIFLH